MSQPRPYSRVELVNGEVVPVYDDEPINLVVREIEPEPVLPDDYSSAGTRSESESEDEEPQYGTWQPDTSCFIPENKPEPKTDFAPQNIADEPKRDPDAGLWRIGMRNDDIDFIMKFHKERLEKCDDTIKTTAS